MKRPLLFLAACLAFTSICAAQQVSSDSPATKADVEKYLEMMHSREMMNKVVDAMAGPMHQMIHDQCVKDNDKEKDKLPADCEARVDESFEESLKAFPWNEMIDAMVPIYQKHFTEGDISALIAFYSSPTGQKVLRETPAIAADAMQAIMPLVEKQMGAIQQQTQQEIAQMRKESDAKSDRR